MDIPEPCIRLRTVRWPACAHRDNVGILKQKAPARFRGRQRVSRKLSLAVAGLEIAAQDDADVNGAGEIELPLDAIRRKVENTGQQG
jgi:hypothetical protein